MENTNIIWKKFRNSNYEVSNTGLVRSVKYRTPRAIKPILMKSNGYYYISTVIDNVYQKFRLHRMVMECFCGASDLTVDHINGIKSDNRLENLRYCTIWENIHNPVTLAKLKNRRRKLRKQISHNHFLPYFRCPGYSGAPFLLQLTYTTYDF